ncbi:hypothetical protein EMELA_v1c08330 [Mesoplasma melaleucae]|uniref:Uncharacterized protein n=1 Tax=Mesoplasma melaleucae TaxID=81459 RepID=A0A2K8NWX5_9MOLU|nr:hypothetical protein EMELA_v1c08330 [Mesoplasma melaleucae]
MTMSQAAEPGTNSPIFSGKILTLDVGTRKLTEASYRMPLSDSFVTWGMIHTFMCLTKRHSNWNLMFQIILKSLIITKTLKIMLQFIIIKKIMTF